MTCLGCTASLLDHTKRLCDSCRLDHAKAEEPFLLGYIDWEIRFDNAKRGQGRVFPDGGRFHFSVRTKGLWRRLL